MDNPNFIYRYKKSIRTLRVKEPNFHVLTYNTPPRFDFPNSAVGLEQYDLL